MWNLDFKKFFNPIPLLVGEQVEYLKEICWLILSKTLHLNFFMASSYLSSTTYVCNYINVEEWKMLPSSDDDGGTNLISQLTGMMDALVGRLYQKVEIDGL